MTDTLAYQDQSASFFSGNGSGGFKAGKKSKKNLNAVEAIFSNPTLFQALGAFQQAGMDPFQSLMKYYNSPSTLNIVKPVKPKKPSKGASAPEVMQYEKDSAAYDSLILDYKDKKSATSAKFGSAPAGQYLGLGKGFVDIGKLSADLPSILKLGEQKKTEQFQETYDLLAKTPAFANIYSEASGKFSDTFNSDVNKAYEQMAGSALGAGATSGFLNSKDKQASLLGPLALNKVQYLKGIQMQGENQALGYAAQGPSAQFGSLPQTQYANSYFQSLGLGQQQQQFNSQLGFAKDSANKDNLFGIAGSGLGAYAAYASAAAAVV